MQTLTIDQNDFRKRATFNCTDFVMHFVFKFVFPTHFCTRAVMGLGVFLLLRYAYLLS